VKFLSEKKKIYVLDTNILLLDPLSLHNFDENDIVLPLAVLEEIDNKKNNDGSIGFNARESSRMLDSLKEEHGENETIFNKGVPKRKGGLLKVYIDRKKDIPEDFPLTFDKMDNRILYSAYMCQKENSEKEVILVSKDINMRIKADVLGIKSEDYFNKKADLEVVNESIKKAEIPCELIEIFFEKKQIKLSDLKKVYNKELSPNDFVNFTSENRSMLGRVDINQNAIIPLFHTNKYPMGISPLNTEQKLALELLLNNEIKLVTLAGKAGTGKTLLALAASLSQVMETGTFEKLLVARPIRSLGDNDIGHLPGDKDEKLALWMQPIYDNLDFIINNKDKKSKEKFVYLSEEKNIIQIEALSYIRGRSIPNQIIIIDEAQNLSPHEVKTIVTRAGKDTKIIFTGDIEQIDSPYLDAQTNGLIYIADRFKNESIAGHMQLVKGEKSKLATLGSELL
jgi:PhoH-like ATPase